MTGVSDKKRAALAAAPKTLADVKSIVEKRIDTGIEGMNVVLGTDFKTGKRGINVPSSILFGGRAGCGKTLLLTRMMASIQSSRVLYASSEQTLEEIRTNAERVGLTEDDLARFSAFYSPSWPEIKAEILRRNPEVVVIDSLNELTDEENDVHDKQENLIRYVNEMKQISEQKKRAFIIISHLNKKEEIAGAQRIQHIVSGVMRIEKDGHYRVLYCPGKNRWGASDVKVYFRMTPRGLVDSDAPPEPDPEDRPKRESTFAQKKG